MTAPTTPAGMPEPRWKCGNEYLPFHRQASHVNPDYRDGWNACYEAGRTAQACERDAILDEAITALEREFDVYTPYQISEGRALKRGIESIQAIKSKEQGSAT